MREKVGLLAYSPLSTGVLTGKYLDNQWPQGARHTLFERTRARYMGAHVEMAIRRYQQIAKKHGLDLAQMALSFVRSRPFVTSAIVGATTMEQLQSDLGAAELELSPEILTEIEAVYKELPDPTA